MDASLEEEDPSGVFFSDEEQGETATGTPGKNRGKHGAGGGGAPPSAAKDPKRGRPKEAAGAGRHKPRGKSGKKWCRGCSSWLPCEQFAINQNLHFSCKTARDNLYRIAQRQNMTEWFRSVEADDTKFVMALANYNDRTPADPKTGKRSRCKIVCASLKTAIEAATEVVKDDVGEMMCEPEFLEWSKTPRGGMLDVSAAKLKWEEMVRNKSALVHDELGPPKYPTRIRISVKDLIIFRNRVSQIRATEMVGRTAKNPDEGNIQKMINSALTGQGMDTLAAGGDMDFDELARNLASSGSGGSDDGFLSALNTGFIGNIRELVADAADNGSDSNSDLDADGDATGGAGAAAAASSRGKSSAASSAASVAGSTRRKQEKPPDWLDENVIHRAQRAWRSSVEGIKRDLESLKSDSDSILDTVKGANLGANTHFKNSLGLVERRAETGVRMLMESPHDLARLRQQSFAAGGVAAAQLASAKDGGVAAAPSEGNVADGGVDGAEGGGGKAENPKPAGSAAKDSVRCAPPCRNHQDLRTIGQLLSMADEYDKASTVDDIKATTAKLNSFKVAAKQLTSAWKSAVQELTVAYNGWKKSLEASDKDGAAQGQKRGFKGGKDVTASEKKRKTSSLLEFLQVKATGMTTISQSLVQKLRKGEDIGEVAVPAGFIDDEPIADAEPFVVTGVDIGNLAENPVGKSLTLFEVDFKVSDVRSKAGRAMRVNEWEETMTDANDYILSVLTPLCPQSSLFSPALPPDARFKSIKDMMCLFNFGMKGFTRHSSIERGGLWVGRLVTHGARIVVCARASAVSRYMREKGIMGIDVKGYMRDLRVEGFQQLMQTVQVFHATMGPGDFMWMPADYVMLESIMKDDCFGLRVGMILPRDVVGYSAFEDLAQSESTPNDDLSKVVVEAVAAGTAKK